MNLFRQVVRGLTPAEPARPQYYRVPCPRGHVLQGARTEGYQALRCPTCGEGLFILPRSPLPEPPELPRHARTRVAASAPVLDEGPIPLRDAPAGADVIDADVEWEDEAPAPSPAAAAPASTSPAPSAAPRAKPRPRPAPPPEPEDEDDPEDEDEPEEEFEEDARPAPRRPRKPLLIFLAVATLVVAAVALKVRQQRLQDLPKVVEAGRTLGLEALDEGRFDEAKDLLTRAARAADALGGEVEGADDVREGAREAALYVDLVPETLEAIMDEAATHSEELSAWFKRRYEGRSIVLDSVVKANPADGDALEYQVVTPGPSGQRLGHIDVTGFALFENAKPAPGQHFVFGARLADLRFRDNQWWFLLVPDSGVILGVKHPAALDALGMSAGDDPAAGGAP